MEQKQLEKLEELSKLKEKGILTEEEIAKYKEIIMSENKAQDDKIEQVLYVICWILILVFGLFFYYVSNVEYKNEVEPSKPSYENELRGSFDNMSRIHQSFYCVGFLEAHYEITANANVAQSVIVPFVNRIKEDINSDKNAFQSFYQRGYKERGYMLSDSYEFSTIFPRCVSYAR